MTDVCCVCVESFTKQAHRKPAKCPYCDVKACTTCTQTYLLNTTEDPHCMGCRRGWTREVLDQILLTTWVNGAYKKHREDILMDRERSRLPAAQIIVERRKLAAERRPILDGIQAKILELNKQIGVLQHEYYRESRIVSMLMAGSDPWATAASANKPAEERRVFIMPCPAADCRGFLSQAYKCGVCDVYVCPECREVKGLQRDGEHTCNPDTVATVQKLKKECRGCPECGTQIFKIEGCDQMFCTNCNTPFSWTTGKKVLAGAIHNPHYFEYLRKMNNGVQPRTPGDIPCLANLPGAWEYDRLVTRRFNGLPKEQNDALYVALMTIQHIHNVEIQANVNNAEDLDTTDYAVRYLMKEIDGDRWKQLLQQKEKKRAKKDEVRQRYEAAVGAAIDIFGRLMALARANDANAKKELPGEVFQTHANLLQLVDLFNNGMMDISRRYKCQVLIINPATMRRERKKFVAERKKSEKKKGKKKVATVVNVDDSDDDSESDLEEIEDDEPPRENLVVQTV
jgi:hypothetical protein